MAIWFSTLVNAVVCCGRAASPALGGGGRLLGAVACDCCVGGIGTAPGCGGGGPSCRAREGKACVVVAAGCGRGTEGVGAGAAGTAPGWAAGYACAGWVRGVTPSGFAGTIGSSM